MANVTNLSAGSNSSLAVGSSELKIYRHTIDFADAVAEGLATTEYVTVFTFPADTYYEILAVEVIDALSLGAGARIDLGDAGDDDEYVTNATTLTAGTRLTLTADTKKLQNAASEIRLKVTGATIASGVISVIVQAGNLAPLANAKFPTPTVVGS